jgi:signal transduction histidine kinase/ActR/RegA family two-component response regulator
MSSDPNRAVRALNRPRTRVTRLSRKYSLVLAGLVCGALLVSQIAEISFSYFESRAALVATQNEQATRAATTIRLFLEEITRQIEWTMPPGRVGSPTAMDERRDDILRLLRQYPVVAEVQYVDASGHERLHLSRGAMNTVDSNRDFSGDPAVVGARGGRPYFGPVQFRNGSEPYMAVAVAETGSAGVTIAQVNLKLIWSVVSEIKIGTEGHAYVVDSRGNLIADPNISLVLRQTNLSSFAQVRDALARPKEASSAAVAPSIYEGLAFTSYQLIDPPGWLVFVEQPAGEAFQPIFVSIVRSVIMLGLGLLAAILASILLAHRMVAPLQALTVGATRIGGGELDQRVEIKTGDELEELAEEFNRMAARLEWDAEERQRLAEELLRAQRLETAGRVAGQVAHDFNNLLSPLVAYPDIIKLQLPEDHPARAACDRMIQAAELMAEINGELLALGRRGHMEQEALSLNTVAQQVLDELSLPATIDLGISFATDVPTVLGSSAQLARVITNLVTNAREAMDDRGRIQITTKAVYLDEPVRSRLPRIPVGEYAVLEVADTGAGIAPDVLDKMFDAFFTTKGPGRRRGAGLGLSVVQAIVDDHRGFLGIDTEVGKGSTFRLYLPASHEAVAAKPENSVPGGSETVLVVDDDGWLRDVTTQLLESLGYRAASAASGEEAVRYLQEHTADILVLDMIMPSGWDGAETYRRILEFRPRQRAILLSGFAESERVAEAQRLGAGPYLRKPATRNELARAVRTELDRPASAPVHA